MPDRFITVTVPADRADDLRALLERDDAIESWHEPATDEVLFHLLLPANRVERLLDPLQSTFVNTAGFRVVVLSVEASLPRREEPESEPEVVAGQIAEPEPTARELERISREELYEALSGYARPTRVFMCTVVLSTIVAAIGLVQDSAAVVIGAMVIAPLLGPNVALALATTLGDARLARQALGTNVIGLLLATAVAFLAGLLLEVDADVTEMAARTRVGLNDLVLALAAGVAGALAFTSGVASSLVGVMVAVALLPPLVVFAILLAVGRPAEALNALLLVGCNVVCVNLAGVATFLVQGVSPLKWWEAERSRKMARRVLLIWCILLATLAALVLVSQV